MAEEIAEVASVPQQVTSINPSKVEHLGAANACASGEVETVQPMVSPRRPLAT